MRNTPRSIANRCCRVLTKHEFKRNYIMFLHLPKQMFLLSTSFLRLLSFVFVFVVVSFSLLSLGCDYSENNNNKHSARRRPFKAKKGKVRLLIRLLFCCFFLNRKRTVFLKLRNFFGQRTKRELKTPHIRLTKQNTTLFTV
mgnify:CR=1 FL=1